MLVKVCPICEKRFATPDPHRVYCSKDCKFHRRKKLYGNEVQRNYDSLKALRRTRRDEAKRQRSRLAKRDAEYAKLGTRVVVDCVKTTDGRTLVVENRGRVPAGFGAAAHVSHN